MESDSFVLSIRTQNINAVPKNLPYLIDFNNLNENHKLFSD